MDKDNKQQFLTPYAELDWDQLASAECRILQYLGVQEHSQCSAGPGAQEAAGESSHRAQS